MSEGKERPMEKPAKSQVDVDQSEVAQLRKMVEDQQKQIDALLKAPQQMPQGYVPVQPVYVDSGAERRRLETEKLHRKSRVATETKAQAEQKLVAGDKRYFVWMDREPMMGRVVGVRDLNNQNEEVAIAKEKYLRYFGITAITEPTKQLHAEPFEESHWQKIPSHVRESLDLQLEPVAA